MTASERIRAARLEKDKHLVSALEHTPFETRETEQHSVKVLVCFCPDDCNCRRPWRTNFCGCKAHA